MVHIFATDGLLFRSETSQYRKLTNVKSFDYPNWVLRCNGEFLKYLTDVRNTQMVNSNDLYSSMSRIWNSLSSHYEPFKQLLIIYNFHTYIPSYLLSMSHLIGMIMYFLVHDLFCLLLELGTGWDPAYIDDNTELEFIQRQEQISADDRSYWVGGLSPATLDSYS